MRSCLLGIFALPLARSFDVKDLSCLIRTLLLCTAMTIGFVDSKSRYPAVTLYHLLARDCVVVSPQALLGVRFLGLSATGDLSLCDRGILVVWSSKLEADLCSEGSSEWK